MRIREMVRDDGTQGTIYLEGLIRPGDFEQPRFREKWDQSPAGCVDCQLRTEALRRAGGIVPRVAVRFCRSRGGQRVHRRRPRASVDVNAWRPKGPKRMDLRSKKSLPENGRITIHRVADPDSWVRERKKMANSA